jgi:hypothetical protein
VVLGVLVFLLSFPFLFSSFAHADASFELSDGLYPAAVLLRDQKYAHCPSNAPQGMRVNVAPAIEISENTGAGDIRPNRNVSTGQEIY